MRPPPVLKDESLTCIEEPVQELTDPRISLEAIALVTREPFIWRE
jgi:hypothetical protein